MNRSSWKPERHTQSSMPGYFTLGRGLAPPALGSPRPAAVPGPRRLGLHQTLGASELKGSVAPHDFRTIHCWIKTTPQPPLSGGSGSFPLLGGSTNDGGQGGPK